MANGARAKDLDAREAEGVLDYEEACLGQDNARGAEAQA